MNQNMQARFTGTQKATIVKNYLFSGLSGYFGIAAAMLSYKLNGGFWWAVLHTLLGPWYLGYLGVFRWQEVLHIWAR